MPSNTIPWCPRHRPDPRAVFEHELREWTQRGRDVEYLKRVAQTYMALATGQDEMITFLQPGELTKDLEELGGKAQRRYVIIEATGARAPDIPRDIEGLEMINGSNPPSKQSAGTPNHPVE